MGCLVLILIIAVMLTVCRAGSVEIPQFCQDNNKAYIAMECKGE